MTWSTGLFRTTKRIKCATIHWSSPAQNSLLYFIATYLLVVVGCRRRRGWLSSAAAAPAIVSRTILVFKVIALSCNYYLNVCKWYWLVWHFSSLSDVLVLVVSVRARKADAPFEQDPHFIRTDSVSFPAHCRCNIHFVDEFFFNEAQVCTCVYWCVGTVLPCASPSCQQCNNMWFHHAVTLCQLPVCRRSAHQSKAQIQFISYRRIVPRAEWIGLSAAICYLSNYMANWKRDSRCLAELLQRNIQLTQHGRTSSQFETQSNENFFHSSCSVHCSLVVDVAFTQLSDH